MSSPPARSAHTHRDRCRPIFRCAADTMEPFFVALFIVPLMVTYPPSLSLWLPHLIGLR